MGVQTVLTKKGPEISLGLPDLEDANHQDAITQAIKAITSLVALIVK